MKYIIQKPLFSSHLKKKVRKKAIKFLKNPYFSQNIYTHTWLYTYQILYYNITSQHKQTFSNHRHKGICSFWFLTIFYRRWRSISSPAHLLTLSLTLSLSLSLSVDSCRGGGGLRPGRFLQSPHDVFTMHITHRLCIVPSFFCFFFVPPRSVFRIRCRHSNTSLTAAFRQWSI